MKYRVLFMLALVVSASLALSSTVVASEEHQARKMCKSKITEVYGVDRFSDLLTDKLGNHKFKVQGKVRVHNHMYPFKCKIKNGHVKSYAYNGPHDRHPEHNYDDDDDDSNVGAAIAGFQLSSLLSERARWCARLRTLPDRLCFFILLFL